MTSGYPADCSNTSSPGQPAKTHFSRLKAKFLSFHYNFRRLEECSILLRWLDPHPGEKILDVGCGDGYYSRRIASRGAHVIGIDINRQALAIAKNSTDKKGLEFLEMNAEELDFPEAFFDKIISFCVIEHFNDDDRALRLLARALRPGGKLIFSADSLSNPGITEREREQHRSGYAVNNFYTHQTVADKLQKVGLKLERYRYVLTSQVALMLVRFSWKLDDLQPALAPLRLAGYLGLGTVGLLLLRFAERRATESKQGLTLLVESSKPL
ncbi:MAG: class I SAM-dependent methyltransferase [Candidatus Saccharicenans sp.]